MKIKQYIHGESSFTVYLEPIVENLQLLDKFFMEENNHSVLQEIEGYKPNIGFFTVIPATSDWGTVYVAKDFIILTFNKLHPNFEINRNKLFPEINK